MARERDIRSAIRDALVRSGAILESDVYLGGAAEVAGHTDGPLVVAIEPHSTTMGTSGAMSAGAGFGRTAAGWDSETSGRLAWTTQILVTIISRNDDPETRDDAADLMLSYLQNSVNGQILAEGLTVPSATLVKTWTWKAPTPPTRMLVATVWCDYLSEGWDNFDETP